MKGYPIHCTGIHFFMNNYSKHPYHSIWKQPLMLLLGLLLTTSSSLIYAQCGGAAPFCQPGTATNGNASIFQGGIYQFSLDTYSRSSVGFIEGYQYTCNDTIDLFVGTPYSISIQNGSIVRENCRIWVDLDSNGIFDPTAELLFSSNNKFTHSGTLNLPTSTLKGQPLRLRVSCDFVTASLPTPCSTPEYSQVEDYILVADSNPNPPVAQFTSPDTITCTGTVQFQDHSLNAPSSYFWDFGDGNTSGQASPTHTYTSKGVYDVKLVTSNANGADSITKTQYIQYQNDRPQVASCTPATINYCCGYGIRYFSLGTIQNSSPDGQESYQDNTCLFQDTLTEGLNYPLQIRNGSNAEDVKNLS